MNQKKIILIIFLYVLNGELKGQVIPSGFPILEEFWRRGQITGENELENSFFLRPIYVPSDSILNKKKVNVSVLPIISITNYDLNRQYGSSPFGMIPNVGLQQYLSGGFFAKWKFVQLQVHPEIVTAQNRPYKGFGESFSGQVIRDRFHFWNYDDSPERFGSGVYTNIWWGQSSLTFQFGSFEFGAATRNIWWGPGQWNALTFSNNAQGFPHITLNTTKPAKTFLGYFEGQIISGRLESSMIPSSQNQQLNENYFKPFTGDWRYLNAIIVTYNPKWVPGLFLGFSRTYQQFNDNKGNSFRDYFPILDPFQKEKFFQNGNSVDFDQEARDQQATVFLRFKSHSAKAELYFEYGRRDHAFNLRELTLNPEHARAYLIGFIKLFETQKVNRLIQVRGEVTHQQESVNRYIRYLGLGGEASWHTHYQVRGFTNYGQPLGVGIGTGSNIQTLEISFVEKFNKFGVLFERLENHQDFYYRAFGQQNEHKPWIDLSLGFLFDKQWNNLLLSSKLQLINGINYQWQLHPNSTPEFPKGQNLFSVHAQTSLIYLFNKPKSKND